MTKVMNVSTNPTPVQLDTYQLLKHARLRSGVPTQEINLCIKTYIYWAPKKNGILLAWTVALQATTVLLMGQCQMLSTVNF